MTQVEFNQRSQAIEREIIDVGQVVVVDLEECQLFLSLKRLVLDPNQLVVTDVDILQLGVELEGGRSDLLHIVVLENEVADLGVQGHRNNLKHRERLINIIEAYLIC